MFTVDVFFALGLSPSASAAWLLCTTHLPFSLALDDSSSDLTRGPEPKPWTGLELPTVLYLFSSFAVSRYLISMTVKRNCV